MVRIDRLLKTGLMKLIKPVGVSDHDFRTEIIKKSTGAV